MSTIIAFDPGVTTGYAIHTIRDNGQHHIAAGDFHMYKRVLEYLNTAKPSLVIIESFRLYAWKSKHKQWSGFPEVEVIGAIKFACDLRSIPWIEQQPSTKQLFDDGKLKKLGLWKNLSPHGRDAARHALFHITTGGDHYWLNQL